MGKSVITVEYFCDAGRRQHELYEVSASPRRARKAVREAIREFNGEDVIIKATDMDQASLRRWVSNIPWAGVSNVWYLSEDGLFATCNAWTAVSTDMVDVREDDDVEVTECVSAAAQQAADDVWNQLRDSEAKDDEEALCGALRTVEEQLVSVQTALQDRDELTVPAMDLSQSLTRLLLLAGKLDGINGYTRI